MYQAWIQTKYFGVGDSFAARSCQLNLIKMRAKLANLNNCAVPF